VDAGRLFATAMSRTDYADGASRKAAARLARVAQGKIGSFDNSASTRSALCARKVVDRSRSCVTSGRVTFFPARETAPKLWAFVSATIEQMSRWPHEKPPAVETNQWVLRASLHVRSRDFEERWNANLTLVIQYGGSYGSNVLGIA